MSEEVVAATELSAGHPHGGLCPNCGAGLAVGQKYCIRCGLRYDAAAFARLAALDAERRSILAALLPPEIKDVPSVPPIQCLPLQDTFSPMRDKTVPMPLNAGVMPDVSPPSVSAPVAPHGGALPWLLPTLLYGGGTLMVIGTLVYLRSLILERPAVQLGLVTLAMVACGGLAVRGLRRQPDDLLARGWLWLGMLLLPLDLWLGVRSGWLPSGIGWAYALACAAGYWWLAAWLADRALPHLAVFVGLVAVLWCGLDVLPSAAAAIGLLSVVATGLVFWSVHRPAHVAAVAGRWWGGGAVGLCAVGALVCEEVWLGGVAGCSCLVLGYVASNRPAAWVCISGGLGLLTLSYGWWLMSFDLPASWMAAGWAGWLWVLSVGQIVAEHWTARQEDSATARGENAFAAPLWLAGQILGGALGLWTFLALVVSSELRLFGAQIGDGLSGSVPLLGSGFACSLLLAWSWWQMRNTLRWFPFCVAVVSILAISGVSAVGAMETQVVSQPAALLVMPVVFCLTRLGVEWAGVWLGQEYSTEVDTNFGLDFGLPHHPAIIPSRLVVDFCAALYFLGCLVLATVDWRLVHTVGMTILVGYAGLGWFLSSTPVLQRLYALAMWSAAYLGLVVTGCGVGRVGWFDLLPWVTLVAAGGVVAVSRPVVDENHLRTALRQVSLFVLGVGAVAALVGIVLATGPEVGHGLVLAAAASAGWVAAIRQRMFWLGPLATGCGGLAAVQAARLGGCPVEGLPLVGVLYGYSAAWLGWRGLRRTKDGEPVPWGGLAAGGQLCLWVGAAGALCVLEGHSAVLIGCSLVCASGALAVVSFLTREATHDLYALGALVWGAVTYVWWLRYLALPPFVQIACLTLPYGAVVASVGWLKWRWQRGHPALAHLLIWLGSFLFCFPVAVQAALHRLSGRGALGMDMLADATALTALVLGLSTGWVALSTAGGLALALHLFLVLMVVIPWGDIPYGVYLALLGLTLFGGGVWLRRWYRQV